MILQHSVDDGKGGSRSIEHLCVYLQSPVEINLYSFCCHRGQLLLGVESLALLSSFSFIVLNNQSRA